MLCVPSGRVSILQSKLSILIITQEKLIAYNLLMDACTPEQENLHLQKMLARREPNPPWLNKSLSFHN